MDKFDALFNFNIKILNALSMCVSVPRYFCLLYTSDAADD